MPIGEALAAAREQSGLTVDDVAQATRIRATLVRAIERDDFSLCGGAVYARGHLRSIAHTVGIDAEPLVAEYDATYGSPVTPLGADTIFEVETRARPERTGPRWGVAMVASLLVAVCALATYSIMSAGGRTAAHNHLTGAPASTTTAPPAAPTTGPAPTTAAPTTPPVTAPPSDVAVNPTDGVRLRLRITGDRSWVSVSNSAGHTLVQKVFDHGQVADFADAKLLHLVVGDAAAVDLIVNGKELGPPGGPGAVVQLTFRPGDPGTSAHG